jgi:P4 family phage/plasmid primase-like protien
VASDDDELEQVLDGAELGYREALRLGEPGTKEFTENAIARRFARRSSGILRFNHTTGTWLAWGGTVWCPDDLRNLVEQIRCFVEAERRQAIDEKELAAMGRVSFVFAVDKICRSDPIFAVHQGMLDQDPWLMGTPDGVVNLRTSEICPGQASDLITRQTAVAPAPSGTAAPNWQAFLDQATLEDRELQEFLQRRAGYCLSGDVTEETLTFLYGPGGNGKGVFVNTVTGIMGRYAVSMPMEAFTAGARLPAEYYRAQMAGARLVTASETESGRAWAESQIKELTGNEAPVSARHPYGRPFTFQPQCKLQFVGNHAPKLKARSPAMERRLRMVPFLYRPPQADPKLKDRLREEWPAILRWMIDGCLAWQQDGLGTAAVIEQASNHYFEQQDAFGRWLEENCVLSVRLQTRPGALYSDYQTWCVSNGEMALTSSEFAEQRDRTPGLITKTINGAKWVVGIGLSARPDGRWPD